MRGRQRTSNRALRVRIPRPTPIPARTRAPARARGREPIRKPSRRRSSNGNPEGPAARVARLRPETPPAGHPPATPNELGQHDGHERQRDRRYGDAVDQQRRDDGGLASRAVDLQSDGHDANRESDPNRRQPNGRGGDTLCDHRRCDERRNHWRCEHAPAQRPRPPPAAGRRRRRGRRRRDGQPGDLPVRPSSAGAVLRPAPIAKRLVSRACGDGDSGQRSRENRRRGR